VTTPIVVTGGAGFIGSHTCKQLALAGYLPVVYDNLSTGNRQAVKWGPLVEGDIADVPAMRACLVRYQPAAIIHFAASAYVGESVDDPAKYYRNNVVGLISVLDACRSAGVGKLIFSSSCATYGVPATVPIGEDSPQNPINPYGRTKLMGESVLEDYAAAYGIGYAILRYFNAGGADPEGQLGEWHSPETHVIPRALLAASGQASTFEVFGNDYPTADGTCIRDYVHVQDLARAHVLAAAHLLGGGRNLRLNLGTGQGTSVNELLAAIERVTGRRVPTALRERRQGDPPSLVARTDRAAEVLGFVPELSDIDTIVKTAAPFFGIGSNHA